MKMHKCEEICELLSSYLDQELTLEEQKQVQEHLESCPQCRVALEELEALQHMMDNLEKEELEAPEGFVQSVMEKIRHEEDDTAENADGAPLTQATKETVDGQGKSPGKVTSLWDRMTRKPWIPAVIAAMLLVTLYLPEVLGPMGQKNTASNDAMEPGFTSAMDNQGPMMKVAPTMGSPDIFMDQSQTMNREVGDGGIPAPAPLPQGSGEETERKIIRNGSISLDTRDYRAAEKQIVEQTTALGGFISQSNVYFYGEKQDLLAGYILIRIPEARFDQAMAFLETQGKVTSRNSNSSDVTEEFIDLETRIRNLKTKETRLLEILRSQGSLQDLLAVENELANTRFEIERLEGRLRFLGSRVELSTIEIHMREVRDLEGGISGSGFSDLGTRIREALFKSVNLLLDYTAKAIVFLVSLIPFLAIPLAVYVGFRFFRKKDPEEAKAAGETEENKKAESGKQ